MEGESEQQFLAPLPAHPIHPVVRLRIPTSLFWSNSPSLFKTFGYSGDPQTAPKHVFDQHSATFGYSGDPQTSQQLVVGQHSITFGYSGDPKTASKPAFDQHSITFYYLGDSCNKKTCVFPLKKNARGRLHTRAPYL